MVQGRTSQIGSRQDMDGSSNRLKITTVGDGMVGKTCLLISYVDKTFPEEYIPTVFDNHADSITVDGQTYQMALWDTAGQEDYERLRPLSYPNTQVFLLCFSLSSRASYENAHLKWYPELQHYCPNVPIVLVGTKSDTRGKVGDLITEKDGLKLKKKIRAAAYVECSAKENHNLVEVFITAVRVAINRTHIKKVNNCTIL